MRHLAVLPLALASLAGCNTARVLTNRCVAPYVAGSAALDLASAAGSRRLTMAGEGGRNGSERHDLIQSALLGGSIEADTGVTWVLLDPSDGTRLVVTHGARLRQGDVLAVSGYPGRRDWGPVVPPAPGAAGAVLVPPGTSGSRLAGTIAVRRIAPLEVRLDLRPEDAGGESPFDALRGTVRFRRAEEERPCFS